MSSSKTEAARAALEYVVQEFDSLLTEPKRERPFILGLGTGSTVAEFWPLLAEYLRRRNIANFYIVPTSHQSRQLVMQTPGGYPLVDLDQFNRVDCLVDGFDAACPRDMSMIKGGGGAHVCEKLVALRAKCRIYVGTEDKIVQSLGGAAAPIPVEVVPAAVGLVLLHAEQQGWRAVVREAKGGKIGPVISDGGNVIVDLYIPQDLFHQSKVPSLEVSIQAITGVVGCGLFVALADTLIVAGSNGAVMRYGVGGE